MLKNAFTSPKAGVIRIELTQDKVCLIDSDDWDKVAAIKWHAAKSGGSRHFYACAKRGKKNAQTSFFMHREIMRPPAGMVVDHINHDTLDNRKSNLRVCTPQQNQFNQQRKHTTRPGRKGVYFFKKTGKWYSQICLEGKNKHLGYFLTDVEAAQAYDNAAKTHFGEYACLNMPA